MCARAELWRPRGSAAAFSASSAAAPWPSVTEDDVGSFRKWRFEARSPGPRTYPPTLRRWGRPQLRKVWASRGRIPPGVRLASDVYSPSAHLLPPAGLPALSLRGLPVPVPEACVRVPNSGDPGGAPQLSPHLAPRRHGLPSQRTTSAPSENGVSRLDHPARALTRLRFGDGVAPNSARSGLPGGGFLPG